MSDCRAEFPQRVLNIIKIKDQCKAATRSHPPALALHIKITPPPYTRLLVKSTKPPHATARLGQRCISDQPTALALHIETARSGSEITLHVGVAPVRVCPCGNDDSSSRHCHAEREVGMRSTSVQMQLIYWHPAHAILCCLTKASLALTQRAMFPGAACGRCGAGRRV